MVPYICGSRKNKDDKVKRILLGDRRGKLVDTVELILRHWGYRVLASSNPDQLARFLEDLPIDLLVLGNNLLGDPDSPLFSRVAAQTGKRKLPLLLLTDDKPVAAATLPHQPLTVPLDIFRLFVLIQGHLESTPRRNLRLKIQLPGMFLNGASQCIAEVLSLSDHGMFIKTGYRVDKLDRFSVIFPLLGMQTEVEIGGRVRYRVQPGPENNYLQGVGIEFTDLTPETLGIIKEFIESKVLGELTESLEGARQFDLTQLQVHSRHDLTLRSKAHHGE